MEVYGLVPDKERDDIMRCVESDLAGWETWYFGQGELFGDKWNSRVAFTMDDRPPTDYLDTDCAKPVFSDRLKRLLEGNAVSGVEFCPVTVKYQDGRDVGVFWHVNVLALAGALDLTASLYKMAHIGDRTALILIKPVIHGAVATTRDMFRFAESRAGVYVSSRFRDLCVKHGMTGMIFRRQAVSCG